MRPDFFSSVLEKLDSGQSVYVAFVANHSKHSPGTRGAKLCVTIDDVFGTIGGGVMEHTIIEEGRGVLASGLDLIRTEILAHRDSGTAKRSGLFCAGEQRMVYSLIRDGSDRHEKIREVVDRFGGDRGGWLKISDAGWSIDDGEFEPPPIIFSDGHDWEYREALFNPFRVTIIGGGHCGRALSKTMSELGYHVTNIDDRPDEVLFVTNEWADVKVVAEFENAGAYIEHAELNHVIVMTANFPSDVDALKSLGDREFAYVGVMGSAAKLKKIQNAISEQRWSSLRAPIGLPIASDTPQEIAISIAGEILSLRGELFPWTLPS